MSAIETPYGPVTLNTLQAWLDAHPPRNAMYPQDAAWWAEEGAFPDEPRAPMHAFFYTVEEPKAPEDLSWVIARRLLGSELAERIIPLPHHAA